MSPPAEPLFSRFIFIYRAPHQPHFEGATHFQVFRVAKSRYTNLILRTDQRPNIAVYCLISNCKIGSSIRFAAIVVGQTPTRQARFVVLATLKKAL